MSTDAPQHAALLVLPRLRVQNANAISSPMTWGFPAITAFSGFMAALARRLGAEAGIQFHGVGVVCHHFEAQVTQGGYVRNFNLTRNPVLADGSTAAIVEEGRIHLDITLVFDVSLAHHLQDDAARASLAARVGEVVAGMRLAGGSVMPPLPGTLHRTPPAQLVLLEEETDARTRQFRRLSCRWLPGFALVSADDVLQTRWADLQAHAPESAPSPTLFDAWLHAGALLNLLTPASFYWMNCRLVRRWQWTEEEDPVKVEKAVGELIERKEWTLLSHRVIFHGRRVCHARKPACWVCVLARYCPSYGIGPTDPPS